MKDKIDEYDWKTQEAAIEAQKQNQKDNGDDVDDNDLGISIDLKEVAVSMLNVKPKRKNKRRTSSKRGNKQGKRELQSFD